MEQLSSSLRSTLLAEPSGPAQVFRVLGPVALGRGEDTRLLPAGKPTTLLAALLLRPNTVVSTGRLKAAVWNHEPHLAANAALHTCVRRLRRALAEEGLPYDTVRAEAGGYRIDADARTCDLLRFRGLVAAARVEGDLPTELGMLREALHEWRGPLLGNVDSDLLHRDEVPRLVEERLAAHERAIDIDLTLGRCREVMAELWDLTRSHPDRERFWEQLIEALYRTGRQAEALAEYRGIKGHLRDQLGIDPGPALRRLELAILRGSELGTPVADVAVTTPSPRRALPAPRSAPSFVGRADLVADLSALLTETQGVTVVLSGPPGIGKTALALHLAGELRDRFAGGCLAIRTTHPDGTPRPMSDLQAEAAPDEPDAPRLLILDDVVDADIARELAGPADTTLVTSRLSLAGLVATHGARVRRPDRFTPAESAAFIRDVLGVDRVAREADAAARLAELCDHFPLALRIAATRLLTRPLLSVADFVAWLEEDPVQRLSVGHENRLAITGVLGAALHRLEPALAEAFLRLGADPVTAGGFSGADAAGVLSGAPGGPSAALHRLADAGFLEEDRPGHFHIHGLLRLFAKASNHTGER
ncbi:BTAD domain-containing putative transcriptional regulator [Nocardioides insulae]|uniref:BTAD domain-containing putative transcriptional regulator n=1 Tax=Nocardioides insulae TaxID=394734 RepID=UPI000404BFC1|nr:BTAD domain-containing putative transcriptional regulator [Nocardioides insulae]